jgi:hypothetical protein
VADDLWERGLYLPSSISLDRKTLAFITDRIRAAAVPAAGLRSA